MRTRTAHRRLRTLAAFLTVIALVLTGTPVVPDAGAAPGDPVHFADVYLENAVNDALGHAPGTTVTEADAESITFLDAANRGISDLDGIEALTNLTTLWLSSNQISDIDAVAGLTDLTSLTLSSNQITGLPRGEGTVG